MPTSTRARDEGASSAHSRRLISSAWSAWARRGGGGEEEDVEERRRWRRHLGGGEEPGGQEGGEVALQVGKEVEVKALVEHALQAGVHRAELAGEGLPVGLAHHAVRVRPGERGEVRLLHQPRRRGR